MAGEPQSLGAQFDAVFREAVKDVRQTMNEVFFGKGEHAPEMGAPMNPTPQIVTAELHQGQSYDEMIQSYAARGGPAQDHEMER